MLRSPSAPFPASVTNRSEECDPSFTIPAPEFPEADVRSIRAALPVERRIPTPSPPVVPVTVLSDDLRSPARLHPDPALAARPHRHVLQHRRASRHRDPGVTAPAPALHDHVLQSTPARARHQPQTGPPIRRHRAQRRESDRLLRRPDRPQDPRSSLSRRDQVAPPHLHHDPGLDRQDRRTGPAHVQMVVDDVVRVSEALPRFPRDHVSAQVPHSVLAVPRQRHARQPRQHCPRLNRDRPASVPADLHVRQLRFAHCPHQEPVRRSTAGSPPSAASPSPRR